MRFFTVVLNSVLLAMCSAIPLFAQENDHPQAPGFLDRTHSSLSSAVFRLSDRFDSFFSDKTTEEEPPRDWLRLTLISRTSEGEPYKFDLRVRAFIYLPGTKDRLQLVVDSFSEENTQATVINSPGTPPPPTANTRNARRVDSAGASLRYFFVKDDPFLASYEVGTRFNGGLAPFTQFRFRYRTSIGNLGIEPTQFFFWRDEEKFGTESRLDLDYALPGDFLFRSRSEGLWSENSSGVDLTQRFSLFKELPDNKSLAFNFTIDGHTEPRFGADIYEVSWRYRTLIHSNWLFLEVEPGLQWPQEKDHALVTFAVVRLEGIFGALPK